MSRISFKNANVVNCIVLLFCIESFCSCSQYKKDIIRSSYQPKFDSLMLLIKKYRNINLDSTSYFANQIYNLSYEGGDSLMICRSENVKGWIAAVSGLFNIAKSHYYKSLAISKKNKFVKQQKYVTNSLGILFYNVDQYDSSLYYHFQSLKLRERGGNPEEISTSCNNIGLIYYKMGFYKKAIAAFERASELLLEQGRFDPYSKVNLSMCHIELGDYKLAEKFLLETLQKCEESCIPELLCEVYINLGVVYQNHRIFNRASHYLQKALTISRKHDFELKEINCLYNFASISFQKRDFGATLNYLKETHQLAKNAQYRHWQKRIYELYSKLYVHKAHFKKAYKFRLLYDSLHQIIYSDSVKFHLTQLQIENAERENLRTINLQKAKINQTNNLLVFALVILILSFFTVFVLYWNFRLQKRSREQIQSVLNNLNLVQEKLIAQEKMAALGQLVAGIAHEMNTPLAALRGILQPVEDYTDNLKRDFLKLMGRDTGEIDAFQALTEKNSPKPLFITTRERRMAKKQLISALDNYGLNEEHLPEKLLDMGIHQLTDAVVAALKSPEQRKYLDLWHNMALLQKNTAQAGPLITKISKVVQSLQTYSQPQVSETKQTVDLRENIDETLLLLHHEFDRGVYLIKHYPDELPNIMANPNALSQVWLNLLLNSIHAVNYKGRIEVQIKETSNDIQVCITDNGTGIKSEEKDKIFEAFYTTKDKGYGTGLGLNISRNIIKNHAGEITFHSSPGKTVFNVFLPKN